MSTLEKTIDLLNALPENQIEMIKSMLKKGISIEIVADISRLSPKEIEKIAKEVN